MGTKHSEVVLFSGGWDSTLCALKYPNADLLFVNYEQKYYQQELNAAKNIAKELNRELIIKDYYLGHDAKDRNLYLILFAKDFGYKKIIVGVRNILPIFDKYKDSNWWTLKKFSWFIDVEILMPIVGYTKSRIVREVKNKIKTIPFNCYKEGALNCDCVNCKEMRKILK